MTLTHVPTRVLRIIDTPQRVEPQRDGPPVLSAWSHIVWTTFKEVLEVAEILKRKFYIEIPSTEGRLPTDPHCFELGSLTDQDKRDIEKAFSDKWTISWERVDETGLGIMKLK